MRQLTVSQKKLLNRIMAENKEISSVDDLSTEIWDRLEAINDTEILYQEVNRYIQDKRMKEIYL